MIELKIKTKEGEKTFTCDDVPFGVVKEVLKLDEVKTDWYVTRFIETQKPIPNDILQKRQETKLAICFNFSNYTIIR